MQDFTGRTIVLRVDETSLGGTTLVSDIAFLQQRNVRPIVVAPQAEVARAFVGAMNRSGDAAVGLRGADAGMIPAAGTIIGSVQTRLLETLTRSGYVPGHRADCDRIERRRHPAAGRRRGARNRGSDRSIAHLVL